jgi:MipA family protein
MILLRIIIYFVLAASAEEPVPNQDSLYEIGVGGGGGYLPAYPGSDKYQSRFIVLPYVNYRGPILRSDDKEGTRARIMKNDIFDLDLSYAGSFPSSSSDVEARRGMPDLDWLGEIGPRLEILLKRYGERGRLRILLPVRVALSTNWTNFNHRGLNFSPALHLELHDFLREHWKFAAKIQCAFVDEKLARYFYEVEEIYVTPTRPYYGARSGYLESDFMLSLSVPLGGDVRFFLAGWLSSLGGSANSASPLFKSEWNTSVGLGLSWMFHKSAEPGHL